jgi:hypothetical protein
LAALPHDMYVDVMANWRGGDAAASFFDKSLAMLVHTTAVNLCKLEEKAPAAVAEVVAKVEKKAETRKIKASNFSDPCAEAQSGAKLAPQRCAKRAHQGVPRWPPSSSRRTARNAEA